MEGINFGRVSGSEFRDRGVRLSVLGEFFRFGGMDYDIMSREDFMPAAGAMSVIAHRTIDVAHVSGVGTRCEIDDRNLSSVYGGEYS